jgi:glycogen operon protein
VTYERKHNRANGEDNRDGNDHNRSQNFGVEGETDDAEIVALRRRVAANLMVTLCLSTGVPMFTAGDERGRTQRGNNNPYVQDNEISWVDWRPDDAWLDVYEITKAALRLRREHPTLRQRHWFEGRPTIDGGRKDLTWLHPTGREMTGDDWADDALSVVGMLLTGDPLRSPGPRGEQEWDASFLIWLNAEAEPVAVTMPPDGWNDSGEVVVSTCPDHAVGSRVEEGAVLMLDARTVVVIREDDVG